MYFSFRKYYFYFLFILSLEILFVTLSSSCIRCRGSTTMTECPCFMPSLFSAPSTFLGSRINGNNLEVDVQRPTSGQLWMRDGAGKKSGGGKGFGGKGFGSMLKQVKIDRFRYTGPLRPGTLSPTRSVPEHIKRPKYAKSGIPRDKRPKVPWDIEIKDADTIARMRVAGKHAREILDLAGAMAVPGVTTDEIDELVHRETLARGGYPSPLNYNRFPKSCCTSVNEVVCHGIPDDTVLVEGDIINIDITIFYDGVHGDCSETFIIGDVNGDKVDPVAKKLVKTTYDALWAAINICGPGVAVNKIGGAIQTVAHRAGFSVVRNFVGHGIGEVFHTTPNVFHYKNSDALGIMEPGMTFTIEPMLNEGTHRNVTWPDEWTATTQDGKRSAQFEHTLLITDSGVEALTGRLSTSPKLFWEKEE